MIELYDYILSDDAYKARLLLSFLGLDYTRRKVDMHPGREHLSPAFKATVSPLSRLPVIRDGDLCVAGPLACLSYLAKRYDESGSWMPDDPARQAEVLQWMAFAEHDMAPISALRMARFSDDTLPAGPGDDLRVANAAMAVIDDHLAGGAAGARDWLVGDGPTIADIAVFGTAALAPDAGVAIEDFPELWRWTARLRHLPGFVVIPGVFPVIPELTEGAA